MAPTEWKAQTGFYQIYDLKQKYKDGTRPASHKAESLRGDFS
jgi:hypothetical protein